MKIENAREEGMGTEGWREQDALKSQIENAGEEGMWRGVQRERIFKSKIEIATEERMAGWKRMDRREGIEMQIESAWQESMKRGAELKYRIENAVEEGMGRGAWMMESHKNPRLKTQGIGGENVEGAKASESRIE